MSVPAGAMAPPGLPPGGPPPGVMPAPPMGAGGQPMPSGILAGLASALQAEVQQKEMAAQSALVTLTAQLAGQPDPASAAAVTAPGPLTAAGSGPPDPTAAPGGYQ